MALLIPCSIKSQATSSGVNRSNSAGLRYAVASIRENHQDEGGTTLHLSFGRLEATHVTVLDLLRDAYHVQNEQILDAPNWVSTVAFDIRAVTDDQDALALKQMPYDQRLECYSVLMRNLLSERFGLKVRTTSRETRVLALVRDKNGPKRALAPAESAHASDAASRKLAGGAFKTQGGTGGYNSHGERISMADFAKQLSRELRQLVIDKTGLEGMYTFSLHWDKSSVPEYQSSSDFGSDADHSGITIFTALREQLGLKLEMRKASVPAIVIEHIDRPSQN